ncbi:MAG TPA: Y-family DNA polymerase [Chitinophagaceae bacterium]|nr:Y-family DNA polymerase [Chitinophagaceae bacterium]
MQTETISKIKEVQCSPFRGAGGFTAVVDCNSFYCSAERVFRPDLHDKPVVVLSNNDGCIVSRSDESKKLGVSMADPYFKSKDIIEQHGISVFSSNYNLYGDMSWRVMETLRIIMGKENVEVYSVDEAFLDMREVPFEELYSAAMMIRQTVEQWTGVAVSVGVAPTKTLSKVANHIAKKNKQATQCVTVLETEEKINEALCLTPVRDIWGVGGQYADKLKLFGIYDAYQLSRMPEEWARKNLGGVVGLRLIKELKGEPSISLDKELIEKKMIATTRMFGKPVTELRDIKEAVATYTSRAAEKLRRQYGAASIISVFVVPKEIRKPGDHFRHGPTVSEAITLSHATSITSELIKPAVHLAEKAYHRAVRDVKTNLFKKAGVMLSGIVPDTTLQGNLFVAPSKNNGRMLMDMMDNINFSMRNDILKFAATGTERNWKMRQELRSPRYTSRWDELREVR